MSCAISFLELNFLPRYENSLHVEQHSVKGIIMRTSICRSFGFLFRGRSSGSKSGG